MPRGRKTASSAKAGREGCQTADDKALNAEVIVATGHIGHLGRSDAARTWVQIAP